MRKILSHLLTSVNALKDKQVEFRSLTEGMDTTTASGELLFHVFGALAQYERALIRERVVAGLTAAKRCGRIGGSPFLIVGEKLDAIIAALNGGLPNLDNGSSWNICRCPKQNWHSRSVARVSMLKFTASCRLPTSRPSKPFSVSLGKK